MLLPWHRDCAKEETERFNLRDTRRSGGQRTFFQNPPGSARLTPGRSDPPSEPPTAEFLPHERVGHCFISTVVCDPLIVVLDALLPFNMAPHLSNDEVCLLYLERSHCTFSYETSSNSITNTISVLVLFLSY